MGARGVKLIGLYSPKPRMGKGSLTTCLADIVRPTAILSFAKPGREIAVALAADFLDGGESEAWDILNSDRKDTYVIPGLGVTMRHMLQTVLTQWGRKCIHPDVWVKKGRASLRRVRSCRLVIFDDMRFPNEYHMLAKANAALIRIERKGAPAAREHESNGLLEDMDFDYHVSNDGEIEELRVKALLIAKEEGLI